MEPISYLFHAMDTYFISNIFLLQTSAVDWHVCPPPPPRPWVSSSRRTMSQVLFITHNTVSDTKWMLSKCKCNSVKLSIKESRLGSHGEYSCQPAHAGSGPPKTLFPPPLQILSDFLDHTRNPSTPSVPLASCSHLLKSKNSTLVFASCSPLSGGLHPSPLLGTLYILTSQEAKRQIPTAK